MEQEWSALLAHPAIQSGALPFGLAVITTGWLRLRGQGPDRPLEGGLTVGIAFLVSALLVAGLPEGAPFSAVHKLVSLAIIGVLTGAILQLMSASTAVRRTAAIGLFLVASLWLAWPQLQRDTLSWQAAVVVLASAAVLYPLATPRARCAEQGVQLILVAGGLAGVAVVSGSLVIAQLAVALAMATLGFLVWTWPHARATVCAGMLLGAWVPAFGLALLIVLLTSAPAGALAPLIVVFVLAPVTRRLGRAQGRWREAWPPLYLLVLGSIPVVLAVVMAMLVESPDDAYYR